MCVGGGGPAVSTSTKSVKVHLTCEPSPGQVLLCACYGDHFILCVCYVFVSGLPYSAYLMDSTSHHGVIGQPTTKFSNRVDVTTQASRGYCS